MTNGSTDYKAAAEAKFGYLSTTLANTAKDPKKYPQAYWQVGHVFDTILDYFACVSADAAPETGKTVTTLFSELSGNWNALWYDDHEWWGIAALRASQRADWFGSLTSVFEQIQEKCWATVTTKAPYVYDQRPKPAGDPFSQLQPRFAGGVWNSSWNTTGINGGKPCNPCLELWDQNLLCGYQNSVTNLMFLILASRLYAVYGRQSDKDAADNQYGFFDDWFGVTTPAATDGLLDRYEKGKLSVRAEVSTYHSLKAVCEYSPDFLWSGDQGLLLGALVERMAYVGAGDPDYAGMLTMAEELVAGTYDRFATNGALTTEYWLSPSSQASNDPGDYETGIAVFFRYLLHAYQANSDLKAFLSDPSSEFPAFVAASADYAAKQDSASENMVYLANDLAALVAAYAMVPQKKPPSPGAS